jgi:hypothetical protein
VVVFPAPLEPRKAKIDLTLGDIKGNALYRGKGIKGLDQIIDTDHGPPLAMSILDGLVSAFNRIKSVIRFRVGMLLTRQAEDVQCICSTYAG